MTKWEIKRGDIIMCDLGKREGSVQSGIRPCVVVSNNYGNKYSNILLKNIQTIKKGSGHLDVLVNKKDERLSYLHLVSATDICPQLYP